LTWGYGHGDDARKANEPGEANVARLQGKVALITGGGSGIGRAAALLFAREGAKVVIAEIVRTAGEATVAAIEEAGGEARFVPTDVTRPEQVEAAVNAAVDAFGGLHVLYNNAGGATPKDGKVTEMDLDEFWRTIGVDLFGTFLGCRFGIPVMAKGGGGSIINTTSVRAMIGTPGADAYTSAKGRRARADPGAGVAVGRAQHPRQCDRARRGPDRAGQGALARGRSAVQEVAARRQRP
jgi:short chain dehydrogenase